ncbi:hypothetical protein [Hymenobacter psychrophilus]|uniref:Uncharacterized protein n=1 Tax=Hymenobacter psychrophilus TaxID=651662 RepID=A0A1H3IRN5_9BACT|nr:hypothetical protein [Hymenobacter psychrophilus]SDY30463.1 hypothetical protein SAMN04488069_107132 [Hymenobacter psychrophilus]
MAQQTGILGLQGTVGGLVFRKDGSVAQKPASNKAAFASAPSRARTRENAAEFGLAASYGKLLRDSLRVAIAAASDSRVAARLTKVMREVIGLDDTSERGQRVFDTGNSAPLLGFNFNAGAGIAQTMYFPFEVTGNGADVTMRIASLNPAAEIAAPQGATHFEVVFAAAALDMEMLTFKGATVSAPLGVLPLNATPLAEQNLVATFATAPTSAELVVGVVGINFYQQVNGKNYPLNNNSTNPLAIEYVA